MEPQEPAEAFKRMELKDYVAATHETAIYPQAGIGSLVAINYAILGLVGEAGELANKIKKAWRGDGPINCTDSTLRAELGDVLWYVARLMVELKVSPEDLMEQNIAKLRDRKERGVIKGSGDAR